VDRVRARAARQDGAQRARLPLRLLPRDPPSSSSSA
jgi:hypothetical protein